MVGAITINTILTFGAILVVLVVGMIVTYPEIAVVPIVNRAAAVSGVSTTLQEANFGTSDWEYDYWNIANWNRTS